MDIASRLFSLDRFQFVHLFRLGLPRFEMFAATMLILVVAFR